MAKWKESSIIGIDSYSRKSYPHSAKGDLLKKDDVVKSKWKKRIQSWIGVVPDIESVPKIWNDNASLDFKFSGDDGREYRIYHEGETSKSMRYVIQKFK